MSIPFSHTADLSAWQAYTITGWVSYPGDTYPANDTLLPVHFQTTPLISTYPYLQGFETNNGYWYTGGINSSWQWGTPQKTVIDKAANGLKCWVTSLTGDYNNNELSYLYSPCFDISSLQQPILSFSHIFQTEDDCACDYHWAEYSTDGVNWIRAGSRRQRHQLVRRLRQRILAEIIYPVACIELQHPRYDIPGKVPDRDEQR